MWGGGGVEQKLRLCNRNYQISVTPNAHEILI